MPNELILKLSPSVAALLKGEEISLQVLSAQLQTVLAQAGKHHAATALPAQFTFEEGRFLLLRYEQPSVALATVISQLEGFSEIEYAQFNHILRCAGTPTLNGARGTFVASSMMEAEVDRQEAQHATMSSEHIAAKENSPLKGGIVPDDSLFAKQWALATLRAVEAWEITTGSRDILVAVIDTGVDLDHPDLQPNLWSNTKEDLNRNGRADAEDYNQIDDDGNGFIDDVIGWDFTDAPNLPDGGDYLQRDNDPSDENGHGTAVSGIIAAAANNRIGIAGLAPNSRIMALRAGNSQGLLEEDDVASAIVYAVLNGARVINMSFGDLVISPMLREVIRFAHRHGAVLVASAGNSASDELYYPAGFAETISVGASTSSDERASFSSYGLRLDVVAPGEEVWTTMPENSYAPFSGTSAAAPLVSALSALLLARSPGMNNEMVHAALHNSARDLGSPGWDRFFGAGRIDALAALQLEHVARAEIHAPLMDSGLSPHENNFVIRGTVIGAFVSEYELAYGAGNNPVQWHLLNRARGRQVLDDSLGRWPLQNLSDGVYTLRLQVHQQTGPMVEDKVRIFFDRTPPQIRDVRWQYMIAGDRHCALLEFATDDLCQPVLWWRPSGASASFTPRACNYLTTKHRLNFLPPTQHGEIEFYLVAANQSGLESREDNHENYYRLRFDQPEVNTLPLVELSLATPAPAGYLLNQATDFDRNGRGELVLSRYGESNSLGALAIFERTEDGFTQRFASARILLPRDVGDSDGDGRLEILAGYGAQSFVYEAANAATFPARLMWADTNGFWAARFANLDRDGQMEIIGRNDNLFSVWEKDDGDSFSKIAELSNFTRGDNLTGVPHAEIADFDGDGRQEILLGDSDGDLYIYEAAGNNRLVPAWSDSLPLSDSIDFIRAGDFDGDGKQDFAAGCHSDLALNAEHEFDSRHWLFRMYRASGDNQFEVIWEQRFFGLQAPKDFEAGLGAGDLDHDGREELFLNLFPHSYVVKYENAHAQVVWHYQPGRSNTTVVAALEQGRPAAFYFSDGERIRAFALPNDATGAPAPLGFEATLLDAHRLRLQWRAVAGAEGYAIYRATADSAGSLLATTASTEFVDQALVTEQVYRYAVATIDSQNATPIGPLTREVRVRASAAPRVLNAHFFPPYHVAVTFNEPMNEAIRGLDHFALHSEEDIAAPKRPESVALSRSNSEVILAFPRHPFPPGKYTIKVANAFDANGVALDTTAAAADFEVRAEPPRFYLASAKLESPQAVVLQFNLPVEETSARAVQNYALTVEPRFAEALGFVSAEVVATEPASVRLALRNGLIAPLGRRFVITATGVRSRSGLALFPGEGDALGFAPARNELNHVLIYPNPFLASRHAQLTIAGLTESATIAILDEQGRVLTTLQEKDGDGGYHWDTRNANGELLPSGVYLCYITAGQETAWTKFVIVR
ncbi:S8 family serine peptidase [candidate division KSB1 bacterium]|nr:S8 family serine peptidase [candidate division KSB1 bacterium]